MSSIEYKLVEWIQTNFSIRIRFNSTWFKGFKITSCLVSLGFRVSIQFNSIQTKNSIPIGLGFKVLQACF